MLFNVQNDWKIVLNEYVKTSEFKVLCDTVESLYEDYTVYPSKDNIFRALNLTPYKSIKAVILGQDPYFNENEADGLAFSCSKKDKLPPSLKNIFKELESDLGVVRNNGDLVSWAEEGVLLLNTVLTVEAGKAGSHRNIGWENFTDEIIRKINEKEEPVVFILWGNDAIKKEKMITNNKHFIIKSPHPSPLSSYRGFFDSKPFSKINEFLKENKIEIIKW